MLKEIETRNDIENGKVIIDFYSKTCATCKRMLRAFEQVTNTDKTVNVVKIDTASELGNALAKEMCVSQLPSIKVLNDGQVKASYVGIVNVNDILESYRA